jgi:hypothetical protein
MKSKLLAVVATGLLTIPVSSQATLLARDAAGNAVGLNDASRTFIYDTDLNITWLANWNVNGAMTWAAANTWAANLSYAVGTNVINDWRLPTANTGPSSNCTSSFTPVGPVQYYGYGCTGSEMGHLWYTELGNTAGGPLSNTGPFLNMQPFNWSGTAYVLNPSNAWYFYTSNGRQDYTYTYNTFSAVAVRTGDVLAASVPEPSTLALLLMGLGGVGALRRRRSD